MIKSFVDFVRYVVGLNLLRVAMWILPEDVKKVVRDIIMRRR